MIIKSCIEYFYYYYYFIQYMYGNAFLQSLHLFYTMYAPSVNTFIALFDCIIYV